MDDSCPPIVAAWFGGWDVLHLGLFLSFMYTFYSMFQWIYHCFAQQFLNPYADPTAKSYLIEMPKRIVQFIHVILCSLLLCGFLTGVLGHWAMYLTRIMNTAYFLWDGILVTKLWYKYTEAPTLMEKMQLCFPPENNTDKIKIQSPGYNWLHHILTTIAFYGVSQDNRTYVLMTYLCGELALLPFHICWFCHKCEWLKDSVTPNRKFLLQVLTCIMYSIFRSFIFFVMGVLFIIPSLQWCSVPQAVISAFMILVFGGIFLMNVTWNLELLRMTFHFNISMEDVQRVVATLREKQKVQ